MIYKFTDNKGSFVVKNPHNNLYFPLTNKNGTLLSSISPNLAGDIKVDNQHFLTPPASIEDIRGNLLCRRDFFIETKSKTPKLCSNKEILRISEIPTLRVEAGILYHKIIKQSKFLHIEILNFIPYNLCVEIMWIKLKNIANSDIDITPTSFIPLYGRGENNLRDHRHVSSLLNRIYLNRYGLILKPTMSFNERGHKLNEAAYGCFGFEGEGIAPVGQFPTLDYFCQRKSLLNPYAITNRLKPVNKKLAEFDGKESLAAFRFKSKRLKKNQIANYFIVMGVDLEAGNNTSRKLMNTFRKVDSPDKICQSLHDTKKYWSNYLSKINLDFKNTNFNNWLLWVKFQPTLRKLFGCSFLPHFDYGKGGRGWRDLWQDALTLLLNEPASAKKLILDSFKGIKIDGSNATIILKNGDFVSDRNSIGRVWMDHGVWPYITLRLYINQSGDINILNKNTTYFRDHLLKRAKEKDLCFSQKDFILRSKNKDIYKGSVLEHILVQQLTAFFNVGKHNIIRLENADWNDGLDMAAEQGESVTFSFMYAYILKDLCSFLNKLKERTKTIYLAKELGLLLDRIKNLPGKYKKIPISYDNFKEKQKRLEVYFEETKNISGQKIAIDIASLINDLEEKSKHLFGWLRKKEWLDAGFFNGYYDNKGRRVEGSLRGRERIMLASQVFAIMSGAAQNYHTKKIWQSVKTHLKDKKLGGFRLNSDFGSTYLNFGRAFGFSYGDKENGAFFNHMVAMFGYALYRRGFINEGFEVINSIYKMSTSKESDIYPVLPEYFNSQGKGLYLYLTGSASWYMHTLINEILGIKFSFGDIVLEPKLLPANFSKNIITLDFCLGNKKIEISYIKGKAKGPCKIKEAFLEKEKIRSDNSYRIKKKKLGKGPKNASHITIYLK